MTQNDLLCPKTAYCHVLVTHSDLQSPSADPKKYRVTYNDQNCPTVVPCLSTVTHIELKLLSAALE